MKNLIEEIGETIIIFILCMAIISLFTTILLMATGVITI